jgi:hypothetical protein
VVEGLLFNRIDSNCELAPRRGIGTAVDIRAGAAAAELAGGNNAVVVAGEALDVSVVELLEESQVSEERHSGLQSSDSDSEF